MVLPRRASRDGRVARAWTPATSRVSPPRTADDGQLFVVLGVGRDGFRRCDRSPWNRRWRVGPVNMGPRRREGRALEGAGVTSCTVTL